MKPFKQYSNFINYTIAFTIVVAAITITGYFSLSKWEKNLISEKQEICEDYLNHLYMAGESEISIIEESGLLNKRDLSSLESRTLDSRLMKVSSKILGAVQGLEGGFYLELQDEFYGYSFPTSPPPIPVYGPPPRSYNIIKNQALESVMSDTLIIGLHSFSAATFPLATRSIHLNGETFGAIWVRIHIEKDLPIIKLKQILYVVAIIAVVGFLVLMIISSVWAGEIRGIKKELQEIGTSPAYRLKERWGIFTYISQSVNRMLDTIEEEDNRRLLLEKKLIQKEKMASLGRVIAGVAHEVKTPLAIIKTRIQMWQKEVEKHAEISDIISPDAMQMLIDETNRLSSLVNRLLIFSRPIEKNIKQSDINLLLDDVLRFLDYENEGSQIAVLRKFKSDIPLIDIDENSIKQVLINILNNSYESMPSGGKITVMSQYERDKNIVIIEICDLGTGIPEESLEEIFVPFFTLKETGVGLGLAISDQIVKAHSGEIIMVNNSPGGVKCIIKLPVKQ